MRWRRNRITVRPDEGWQPDRVYRVELLPGVTDLRRNRSDRGGARHLQHRRAAAPDDVRRDRGGLDARDGPPPARWSSRPSCPTVFRYRGLADSSGRFSLGPLPAGEYVVSGVLDENRNHLADPREAFDSAPGPARDATARWSCGPSCTTPSRPGSARSLSIDSVSATVEFTQSLDPRQRIQLSAVRVSLLPDSTPVRISSAAPAAGGRQPEREAAIPGGLRQGRHNGRAPQTRDPATTAGATAAATGQASGRAAGQASGRAAGRTSRCRRTAGRTAGQPAGAHRSARTAAGAALAAQHPLFRRGICAYATRHLRPGPL